MLNSSRTRAWNSDNCNSLCQHIKCHSDGMQTHTAHSLLLTRGYHRLCHQDVCTVFHAKRVDCAIFHLLVNISGILHARPTYDISSRSPIFGDHFDTNDKVSHDSHVTQLAEEVTGL